MSRLILSASRHASPRLLCLASSSCISSPSSSSSFSNFSSPSVAFFIPCATFSGLVHTSRLPTLFDFRQISRDSLSPSLRLSSPSLQISMAHDLSSSPLSSPSPSSSSSRSSSSLSPSSSPRLQASSSNSSSNFCSSSQSSTSSNLTTNTNHSDDNSKHSGGNRRKRKELEGAALHRLKGRNKYDPVAVRMKELEGEMKMTLDPTCPYMMRLDGHCFSTFTKSFDRPFDDRISNAMSGAARDLLAHLNCASVYTESDEISCMFRSIDADLRVDREAQRADGVPESELPQLPTREELLLRMSHRGNVQKMTTLSAAYCSVRFCYHLSQEEMTEAVRKQVHTAHFDARAFNLPTEQDVTQNIKWRVSDARRNSKSMFGRIYMSAKEMLNIPSEQIIKMVLANEKKDWHELPGKYKSGLVFKHLRMWKDFVHPITGKDIKALRRVIGVAEWDVLEPLQEELTDLLLTPTLTMESHPRWYPLFTELSREEKQ